VNKSLEELQMLREELIKSISREAGKKLKMLLEEKHIYQQVVIDGKALVSAWAAKVKSHGVITEEGEFDKDYFSLGDGQVEFVRPGLAAQASPSLTLIVENPKLFCTICGEREVFRPVWYQDVVNELRKPRTFSSAQEAKSALDGFQLFYLTFQCQRCLGRPESFIVRRDGWKLGLHGRSPMEHVDVPKYIPKQERDHFRDALIAVHGGKPLAGLFYLRMFMELFARRATGETGKCYGDELMEAYYKILPPEHRGSLPNFKEWYGKLSEPVHTGKADEALFEEAREALDRHFDMRRLFKISEVPPAPAAPTT
jgi:hypothetical protein